jgi:demethylmenaquinone methyltransferase/2-methoxy-6-polyprenyl-1,4-benzoquinol methylase
MFARIAPRYDLMNTLMTGGQDQYWRRIAAGEALSVLSPQSSVLSPHLHVLDVGTGTGKLASAILEAQPSVRVVGVDFTEGMLRMAPRNLLLAGADALQLPFADAQFDAVVSAFVVRNLADVDRGIAEQVRVLRPGGKLVVLETTPGPPGPLRSVYKLCFRYLVPWLGQLIADDPSAYTYLPESTLAFLEPTRLADVLRTCGLHEVHVRRLALGSVAITLGRKPSVILEVLGGAA